MKLATRLQLLQELREEMLSPSEYSQAVIHRTSVENPWFGHDQIQQSMSSLASSMLDPQALAAFVDHYRLDDSVSPRTVAIIMAGNIPLVGFHDWLCVFVSGHHAQIKLSQKDPYLLPHLLKLLEKKYPGFEKTYTIVEKLNHYDAVIATGSNNTNRYFQSYFGHVPHLLRSNRTSVAILDGLESDDQLMALGRDVLQYYGLGCRNVSKIFWPVGFDKERIFAPWSEFHEVLDNVKYKNNYDYNFGLWSLNRIPFYTNDVLLFKEDPSLHARIASVYYEEYEDIGQVLDMLKSHRQELQCILSREPLEGLPQTFFGESQRPGLLDYADDIDTVNFLLGIS